jgi:hypothetical protein
MLWDFLGIQLVIQGLLGAGSVVLAELVRDLYHVAGHYWSPLQPSHNLHHKTYRRDLSVVSQAAYCKAQLYNDVPEAAVMVGITALVALLMQSMGMILGVVYSAGFLITALARSQGYLLWTDFTHEPGALTEIPSVWHVNRSYHWRHHFDQGNAYFCGHFTMVDKMLGTSLSLKGKVIAITGASGTLGQALIQELGRQGAKVVALTTSDTLQPDPNLRGMQVERWQVGQEEALRDRLQSVDILVINHGKNVYGARTPAAIQTSLEVNALSAWRMAEVFLSTVQGPTERATKELWVNTSEAEVSPALSPLYEISKRLLGDLITLRRLDAPCVIRKIILGPFKSPLNPYGVMSARWVAKAIVALAKRDVRNIVIAINPLTYVTYPLKEVSKTVYFRIFSRGDRP